MSSPRDVAHKKAAVAPPDANWRILERIAQEINEYLLQLGTIDEDAVGFIRNAACQSFLLDIEHAFERSHHFPYEFPDTDPGSLQQKVAGADPRYLEQTVE